MSRAICRLLPNYFGRCLVHTFTFVEQNHIIFVCQSEATCGHKCVCGCSVRTLLWELTTLLEIPLLFGEGDTPPKTGRNKEDIPLRHSPLAWRLDPRALVVSALTKGVHGTLCGFRAGRRGYTASLLCRHINVIKNSDFLSSYLKYWPLRFLEAYVDGELFLLLIQWLSTNVYHCTPPAHHRH